MDRINRYFFSSFISSFASLFSTLFLIMSIVFFVRIARVTSYIQVNFIELLKLYLFMLPRILIFTTPIAFFVALTISFYRLSRENESTVAFTFGYSPKNIAKFFLKLSFLVSAFMLFISIIMMPLAENLRDNFTDYKKTQATLNLKASEFGQKFGDWLIYIESDERESGKTIYKELILYSPQKGEEKERVILANSGEFRSIDGVFEMDLKDGAIYTLGSEVHITTFKDLIIRSKQTSRVSDANTIISYWAEAKTSDKRKKDITIYVLVSLFPLASTLFALSFGIVTYRYDKGAVYLGCFGVLFGYFLSIILLSEHPLIAIPAVFLTAFGISNIAFYRKILRKY